MTMTREKMLEIQSKVSRPKAFFRVNRKGCCDRATETCVRLLAEGATVDTIGKQAHPHFAPLTVQEFKDVKAVAADIWKEFQDKRAAEEKQNKRAVGAE
jgi:hypothetical protein